MKKHIIYSGRLLNRQGNQCKQGEGRGGKRRTRWQMIFFLGVRLGLGKYDYMVIYVVAEEEEEEPLVLVARRPAKRMCQGRLACLLGCDV